MLLLFTLTLLLFPTALTLEYSPIQSIPAIPNLPLFGVLYYIWLLLLLLLLFSGEEPGSWEKLALVGIFGLVFIGLWLVTGPNTGLRYDGIGDASLPKYLLAAEVGKIPVGHPNLGYFNFPGMHLLALSIAQISGLTVFQTVSFSLVFHLLLFSVLLYTLFLKALSSPALAALGVLVAIQGNIMLARYSFYPGIWALIFLVMFLILLNRGRHGLFETWPDKVIMFILLAATTVTHLVTSILLVFVLAGIYLVQRLYLLRGKAGTTLVATSIIALFLVVPLAWELYWAIQFFEGVTKVTAQVLRDFGEAGLLGYFFRIAQSQVGAEVPLWAVITRYFWWVGIFLLGSILGLKNLVRIRTIGLADKIETGGLVGVIMLSAAVTLGSPGGAEFYRFLLYGAFFAVPIVLRFVGNLAHHQRRVALSLLIGPFFILSLPTFLAHNNLVGIATYYPSELQAGEFLKGISRGQGEGMAIFPDAGELGVLSYSVPDGSFRSTPQGSDLRDETHFWRSANESVTAFKGSGDGGGASNVFYLSRRRALVAQLFFGIEPQSPGWQELADSLDSTNKVYDNRTVQIYER